MIRDGNVSINGSTVKISPKSKVYAGDVIDYHLPEARELEIQPVEFKLDIVYEDELLLVVNKPRGIVVHPAAGHHNDTLVNYLLHHTRLSSVNADRPGIVHRIDKDTSGLLVVAKNCSCHADLAVQFARHDVTRVYHALVWGEPQLNRGTVDHPLGRHPVERKKFALKIGGKNAVTHWRIIERYRLISLIECRLETGRTHQIRVHMGSLGHSLVGDPVYGRKKPFSGKYPESLIHTLQSIKGQALHAKTLGFTHPGTRERIEFSSNLPDDMQEIISNLQEYKR
jgi:23S rRNA pseudouridine1911/1915/1917 synthase